jgi:hypothetical protein
MDFSSIAPDTKALYRVSTSSGASTTFSITPIVSNPRYAVYGDFGLINDECMDDIIKRAQANEFDTVLHVGDWAYNFETAGSITGNLFMNLAQGYQAIKPVAPAEGNHEACPACPAPARAPDAYFHENFTQCAHSRSTRAALPQPRHFTHSLARP